VVPIDSCGRQAGLSTDRKARLQLLAKSNANEKMSIITQQANNPTLFSRELMPTMLVRTGRYLFTIPSRQMVIVSMGSTWGSSAACNVNLFPNYDEAFTGSIMWEVFGNRTFPRGDDNRGRTPQPEAEAEAEAEAVDWSRDVREPGPGHPTPPPADAVTDHPSVPAAAGGGNGTGACYCYCPPDRTSGKCFEPSREAVEEAAGSSGGGGDGRADPCASFLPRGGDEGACPGLGVVKQCGSVGAEDCSAPNMTNTRGGEFRCDQQCLDCTLTRRSARRFHPLRSILTEIYLCHTCSCQKY
jgi:hypothetical protein